MNHFAVLMVLLLATSAGAEQREFVGVGARPLTETIASTYFIRSADPSLDKYEMALVVFLVGKPGWVREKTDWTSSWTSEPAFSQFVFEGATLRIEAAAGRVKVLTYDAALVDGNVLVVTGLGTSAMQVSHTESLDLTAPFKSDPLRVVVSRSESLQKVLGLARPAAQQGAAADRQGPEPDQSR